MPKLIHVEPPKRNEGVGLFTEEAAKRVSNVLTGNTQMNDIHTFGRVMKKYVEENPDAKARFITWYEEQ